MGRRGGEAIAGRSVATGSVFSTILISTVIGRSAPAHHSDRLIDVGSGDSPYRHVMQHATYVGLDWRPRGRDALLVTADAAALPLADGVADALLCTEVIEHVPDERALAAELARVAAPGATLLLSAPFVHGLHERPYDFRRLTSIGLVSTLEAAGWTVESVSAIGGSVVVSTDAALRWLDTRWRRAVRRIVGRDSKPFDLLTAPSARMQGLVAALCLSQGRHFGPIDPTRPNPRLTLGYVVVCTR